MSGTHNKTYSSWMCKLHNISKMWNILLWLLQLKPPAVHLCGDIVLTGAPGSVDGHAATEQCGGTLQSPQLPWAKTIQQHRSLPRRLWRSQIWYSSSETQSGEIDYFQCLVYRNSGLLVVYMVCIYGQILNGVFISTTYGRVVQSELCDMLQ